MEDLLSVLERAFPFARRLDVTIPLTDDGSFLAEMVLPVRLGESTVQVYRHPATSQRLLEGHLRWDGADERTSSGNGRWSWLVAWDGTASREEISELVVKRVLRHPAIGDPTN